MEQKSKGRPTEAHRNCVVARSLIAQLGDALRGIDQWEDRKLKGIRGTIMAETINGPLHYGKTRGKTLVRIDTIDGSTKLFDAKMPPVETIEFILINEVSLEDWMKPHIDFEILPGDRLYQIDFMPLDYGEKGIFHCVFFGCVHTANAYAKYKGRECGAKVLIGDDARKTLRGKRIYDASTRVYSRVAYYQDFVKHAARTKPCCRHKRQFADSIRGFMKKRYQFHKS